MYTALRVASHVDYRLVSFIYRVSSGFCFVLCKQMLAVCVFFISTDRPIGSYLKVHLSQQQLSVGVSVKLDLSSESEKQLCLNILLCCYLVLTLMLSVFI